MFIPRCRWLGFVRTLSGVTRACVFAGRVTGDDVWCAASLPTAKVISLFSPLPAAATRDRLTNTNHLDGRSREKKRGVKRRREKEGKKRQREWVKIAYRNSAVKMEGYERRKRHMKRGGMPVNSRWSNRKSEETEDMEQKEKKKTTKRKMQMLNLCICRREGRKGAKQGLEEWWWGESLWI